MLLTCGWLVIIKTNRLLVTLDAVIHCRSNEEAEKLWIELEKRLSELGLELHPTKTRIVYCKEDNRQGAYPETKFDFLGYTFRPRTSKNKHEKYFVNFSPAVSNLAKKAMRKRSAVGVFT
jgi:RNA-directed DNA polymerase